MTKSSQSDRSGQLCRIYEVHRTKRGRIGVRTSVDVSNRTIGHPGRVLARKSDRHRPTGQQPRVVDPKDRCSVWLLVKGQVPSPIAHPVGLTASIDRHVQEQRGDEDAEELLQSSLGIG